MNTLLFLSIVQTILLLAIAAGMAVLVRRALLGARSTRKSLHTRRQELYGDVVRILGRLASSGELRKEELLDFRSRTGDAALLFDREIAAYVDEIYTRGVKLISTGELLTSLPVGEERDAVTVENARQTIWLADQISSVKKRFERYPGMGNKAA